MMAEEVRFYLLDEFCAVFDRPAVGRGRVQRRRGQAQDGGGSTQDRNECDATRSDAELAVA